MIVSSIGRFFFPRLLLFVDLGVKKGHKAAAEQLLKCGANIDATCSQRATGLFMSSFYGHADVTFLLIAWGEYLLQRS